MKTLRAGLFALLAVTGFVSAQETPSIGLVTINFQALFFNQINEGAQTAADELGGTLQRMGPSAGASRATIGTTADAPARPVPLGAAE